MKENNTKDVYSDILRAMATDIGYDGVVKALRRVVRKRGDMEPTMSKLDAILTTCAQKIKEACGKG